MQSHEVFMKRALYLASFGEGFVSPNPMVGAVIVKDNKIIGEGYHRKAGTSHAEVNALREAGENARGATLYVTLEPCSHFGKTPPCTEAIIRAGIKRVIAACLDPNPKVAGRGIKCLKDAGIDVVVGVMEKKALQLNESFNKYITTGIPFVVLKYAMTLDGKIATWKYDSKWISNIDSRQFAHKLRNKYDGILVGAGTIIKDNPTLTARYLPYKASQPLRIILDGKLQVDPESNVFNDGKAPTLLVTVEGHSREKIKMYRKDGVEILQLPGKGYHIDLKSLLVELGRREITSILIEGGSETAGNFLDARLIDRIYCFTTSKIIGGRNAINSIGGVGTAYIKEAPTLVNLERYYIQDNILITGNLDYKG